MTPNRVTVSSANVEVTITDRQSAEIALQIVEPVLADYLGKAPEVQGEDRPKTKYVYTVQCPECGHEWEREAENPRQVICGRCEHSWYYTDEELEQMDVKEVEP